MLGAGGGQQVEEVVVRGAGHLGGQGGGEVGYAGVVAHLGGQGPQGGSGVDLGVGNGRLGGPAVEREAHGGPVPAGQAGQPLVGEHEQGFVLLNQFVLPQGAEHLVDPAQGYAAHQSGQLLPDAPGPGGQQVENVLLGAGQLGRQGRCQLLGRLRHGGLHVRGVERVRVGPGVVAQERVGRLQQAFRPRQDAGQGCVGRDFHWRVFAQAAAALLPDEAGVVSGQQFSLGGREGPAVLRGAAQGADGPAGDEGPLAAGEMLDAPEPVAQVGAGQRRTLTYDANGAAPGQSDQQVVGAVAVVVHSHGVLARVGVGHHCGDAVEDGGGVQPLGQQPEPLLRNRVGPQQVPAALGGGAGGGYAFLRGEAPALGARPQGSQVVRHGVHQATLCELVQPFPQRGCGNAPEAGQFVHGGQGRGAQQQQRVLEAPAQGTQGRVGTQALQVDDDLQRGRLDVPDALADGVQDGGGDGASGVAPFQVAPEGVAGHAQSLGGLLLSVPPLVGAHVVADGVLESLLVFLRRAVGRYRRYRRCRLLCRQGDSS